MDLQEMLHTAVSAADQAGTVLLSHFGNLKDVRKKGAIDLVTEADLASEKVILETIRGRFPDHAVLSEEAGRLEGGSEVQWVVDPLDGTTNFSHNIGIFAVSIAVAVQGRPVVGVVFNPVSGERFTAVRGGGAQLNGAAIRVSDTDRLIDSLLVTGFPYRLREMLPPLMAKMARCLDASQGVRRLGAAALDLCFVACGRFEGFWEEYLNPWDTAAASLILVEAGGTVTDFSGRPFRTDMKEILATNGRIHDALMAALADSPRGASEVRVEQE